MDTSLLALLGVFAVMGANQLVMRVGALYARPAVFYPLQAVNVIVGSLVVWFGLPGLEQYVVVGWMVGMLFFLHVVQNNTLRTTWLRAAARSDRTERERAIKAALQRGEE